MSIVNKLFNRVFVLTIERNAERHEFVKNQLKDTDFEFWYGIDVPSEFPDATHVVDIPDSFFETHNIDKSYVSAWTKGQLGAYTSIMTMVKEATKHETVLIFEDDFLSIHNDWEAVLERAMSELPSDWDILLLGYLYYGKAYGLTYNRKTRWMFTVYNMITKALSNKYIKKAPRKFSESLDKAGTLLGGHAYCISKRGANKLTEQMAPMRESGDVLVKKLIECDSINAYTVYPCLFKQNNVFDSKTIVVGL